MNTAFKKKVALIGVALLLALGGQFVFAGQVTAQSAEQDICEEIQGGEWNPVTGTCDPLPDTPSETSLFGGGSLFENVANTLLFLVGAISVIMLIIGGFRYVVSAGDANAVTGAKNTILYAIVGIIVSFLAFAAVRFVMNRLSGTSP